MYVYKLKARSLFSFSIRPIITFIFPLFQDVTEEEKEERDRVLIDTVTKYENPVYNIIKRVSNKFCEILVGYYLIACNSKIYCITQGAKTSQFNAR